MRLDDILPVGDLTGGYIPSMFIYLKEGQNSSFESYPLAQASHLSFCSCLIRM